jgi:hypothetical protein
MATALVARRRGPALWIDEHHPGLTEVLRQDVLLELPVRNVQ